MGYSAWGHKESDTTERLTLLLPFSVVLSGCSWRQQTASCLCRKNTEMGYCRCHPVQQGGIRLHLVRQTDRQRGPGFLTWPWSGQEGWTLSSSLCCPGSWFCGLLPGDEISRASACRWFQEVGARACLSRRSCPWSPAAIPPSLASEALSNATRASRYRSGGTRVAPALHPVS